MANHPTRPGTTEGVMRRVLDNMSDLIRSDPNTGARSWHHVIIEPGPTSDDAAWCLLTGNEVSQRKAHRR